MSETTGRWEFGHLGFYDESAPDDVKDVFQKHDTALSEVLEAINDWPQPIIEHFSSTPIVIPRVDGGSKVVLRTTAVIRYWQAADQ